MEHYAPMPFEIKDCALAGIATGKRAQNLREFRDIISNIHPESIYHHFWGSRLRPQFDDVAYHNDFAAWARHGLHDATLAERLAVIDPTDYEILEDLRRDLIDVIEERLDETAWIPWSKSDQQFHFISSQIVVFNTGRQIMHPEGLTDAVAHMSSGSIFYHFIDARRRTPNKIDDFRTWLRGLSNEYMELCTLIAEVDPYFASLSEIRKKIVGIFRMYFKVD